MDRPPQYPLNFFDPAVKADPYPHYAAMHAAGPVLQNPIMLSQWMVAGYDEVLAFLKDPVAFSSGQLTPPEERAQVLTAATMLNSDPPDHERLRGTVAKAFTPRSVTLLEPRIRETVADLLAPLADGEVLEVASGLSSPLPVLVIAELLGVAAADRGEFAEWSHAIISAINPFADDDERARAEAAATNLHAYFAAEVNRRRAQPTDDLVGRLLAANDDGRLSEEEMLSACVLLLLGGNETTTNLITNTVLALARHPDERKRVVADPDLLPGTIEESLRYDAPVQGTGRIATRDVELGGHTIEQGSLVMGLFAAANHDPARFEDPGRFDVGRQPTQHLSFGHGIHFCLGASLARLEARVAIGELLRLAPEFELTEPDRPLEYGPVFFFHSPTRLEIGPGR